MWGKLRGTMAGALGWSADTIGSLLGGNERPESTDGALVGPDSRPESAWTMTALRTVEVNR